MAVAERPQPVAFERYDRMTRVVVECERRGISLADLAQRIGIDRKALYRIRHGQQRIPEGFMERVAETLNIPLRRLVKES